MNRFSEPMRFVDCWTDNADIFYYVNSAEPNEAANMLIHAPSWFDGRQYSLIDGAAPRGYDAFYEALNEAYKLYRVEYVHFTYITQTEAMLAEIK